MHPHSPFCALLLLCAMTAPVFAAQNRADYPIQAVPFTAVHVQDDFWLPRLQTNRTVSIPYAFKMCEETGRINNFEFAGKLKQGKFKGYFFNDSDVYKVIEGAAYALHIQPDPKLDAYLDDLISKIAAAQEPDGYLYTARTLCGPDYMPPGGKERWSDLGGGHELYCVGHLYEAAVAHFQATGKRSLLNIATKNADLVCSVFGPGRKTNPDGHPEVEIGLVKLYRATQDPKYLEMAKFFLDTRGRANGRGLYGEYAQDHKPLVEQTEAVGHAVRAAYVYAGMADVAALMSDQSYIRAISTIWDDVVGRKLYITGGIGARGNIEGFGDPYELPNPSAYAETCAAIANALWNQRMFLLTGDSKYIDVLERVIYNGFLSGWSLKGDRFFYPNPLESLHGTTRAPWFDCACCPSNDVRFVPSIPGYIYAQKDDQLFVNLFVGGTASLVVAGTPVQITQQTSYPWDGTIKIVLAPKKPTRFTLLVRIPGWMNQPVPSDLYRYLDGQPGNIRTSFSGKPKPASPEPQSTELRDGYIRITQTWAEGDAVEVEFPMPIRRILANDKVKDDRGRVALQRGPIVFCAEGVDQKEGRVLSLILDDTQSFSSEYKPDLLNGVLTLKGTARPVSRKLDGSVAAGDPQEFTAVPYYAWANRKAGQMAVWIAREPSAAKPLPAPTLATTSKATASFGGSVSALSDQLEPTSSIDHNNPFFHVWPHKGTQEWVQYEFKQPTRVAAVDVYWFDDTGRGECRPPQSWKLLARVNGQWKEVQNPSGYSVEKDRYIRCAFEPLETDALRIEMQLQPRWAAGIHEWKVYAADEKLPELKQ